jgi:cation diffusion facilitator CzcD-associated flavoprotein CzcO
MLLEKGARIAVIGGGVSGIATASMLKKNGFQPIIFEKSEKLGGVWSTTYPGVHLQNIYTQYRLSDFDWSFKPDLHPTGEQILRYWTEAVQHHDLDLRLGHEILELNEESDCWVIRYKNQTGVHEAEFPYVIVATGQYSEGKNNPQFVNQENFQGKIITERDITSLDMFKGKNVVVVGFGKSALDMTVLASQHGANVHHVFRNPSWLIPEWILGAHFTHALFTRFGSIMMTSWAQPTAMEQLLHNKLGFLISGFWNFIQNIVRFQMNRYGKNQAAKERLQAIQPKHKILMDFRSSGALGPEEYYPFVADGRILPYHTEISSFTDNSVILKSGEEIHADIVVLSVGFLTPTFPFLPAKYRQILEAENDGTQLYRHMLHPSLPRLAVAGFNHGYFHIASVEIGTQWLCAYLRGELELPSITDMEQSIDYVRNWKREHLRFENARSCAVSTRFQQYNDILLKELGVSPYRKLPNPLAEVFSRYEAADYKSIFEEYERNKAKRAMALRVLPLNT